MLKWLKEQLGIEKPRTAHPKSMAERLEGLIIPVELIRKSYEVDMDVAEAGHKILLATEVLIKASLKKQQAAIEASELLLDQQGVTSGIIDTQYYRSLDVETIIINFRKWLLGDDLTIAWVLENAIVPAFASAFAKQTESRQRKLFNGLRVAVNVLQKLDGILLEPQ